MKKFIYFCGILALIAELVSSCGKDDENEPSFPQKRIANMVVFPEDYPIYNYYEYDDKGRCISSTSTHDGEETKYSYTYEENTMTKTTYSYQGDTSISIYTYNSKGHLESIKGEKEYGLFTYDNQGHLISETINSDIHTSATYEWENENVTKIKRNIKRDSEELTITTILEYTNYRHPTPIKNAVKLSAWESAGALEIDPIFTNLGVSPKNLPVHVISTIDTFTYEEDTVTQKQSSYDIEWVLDGDQYPITINIKKGYTEETHLNVFWE